MRETTIYPSNVQHSDDYYFYLLQRLIAGFNAGLSHRVIAEDLNVRGIKSPRGLPWSAEVVKQQCKRLRNHTAYRSALHTALLRLVYAGRLTVAGTQCLFSHRIGTM